MRRVTEDRARLRRSRSRRWWPPRRVFAARSLLNRYLLKLGLPHTSAVGTMNHSFGTELGNVVLTWEVGPAMYCLLFGFASDYNINVFVKMTTNTNTNNVVLTWQVGPAM